MSPINDSKWPRGIAPKDLKIGIHFDWVPQVSLIEKKNFKAFLESIPSPVEMKEYFLESECMSSLAEIARANSVLIDGR